MHKITKAWNLHVTSLYAVSVVSESDSRLGHLQLITSNIILIIKTLNEVLWCDPQPCPARRVHVSINTWPVTVWLITGTPVTISCILLIPFIYYFENLCDKRLRCIVLNICIARNIENDHGSIEVLYKFINATRQTLN